MGWRDSHIDVTTTIDLDDYADEIMEYMEPDTISDALDMMEGWGYRDGDILDYMLEGMDNEMFLSKVADILTVESALSLVSSVYNYGRTIQMRNITAKDNQLQELREKIRQLEEGTTDES
jgi:hypothetical protein